ncbi:Glycogen phosphorylase [Rubellimicrobium mesophilum DSM 19309]|uniref:glycogen phosphorylase n=1 Tax=Rubellimicrobium mesophilum DSM 19309 TaxID=442562 RepID=A0A017HHS0_9RHOB|nr:alpha-glucan family phosphorylase [Rubellimicrobium mesophilum]EYD73870.1 Glycogen phosphorylase [Rubellimicrobium mesophilum DSM 19309]
MPSIRPYVQRTRIAYLTMEIGLRAEMHTYSGGLGILAGDVARSAADLELPMVFVTLASRAGYLRQEIDRKGQQVDHADPWDPADWATPLGAMVAIELEGRLVWIRPWLYELTSPLGTSVPVILLDTDIEQNDPLDRPITDRLYGGGELDRLKQEAVLGLGGHRMLHALGFEIETYHLNEGHAAFLPLALLVRRRRDDRRPRSTDEALYDVDAVRARCVFTTHTPVEAGHDRFDYADVERVLGDLVEADQLRRLSGGERLNMTHLALSLSGYVNGVARRHAETARQLYPGYRVRAITNGVHVGQWAHPSIARLFDGLIPGWRHDPETLLRADRIEGEALWAAHQEAKGGLLAEVEARTGRRLAPDLPLLGFARRMTGYKRPDLLFSDLGRLKAIAERFPFQVVMAGKAHPKDAAGKEGIRQIALHARALGGTVPVVFVPGYDMSLAAHLVGGCDVWLNNPLPPLEASGTSGMKAALNGVLNFSVLDGWWIEGCEEGVTGWAVDEPSPPDKLAAAVPVSSGAGLGRAEAAESGPAELGPGFLSQVELEEGGASGPDAHAQLLYDKLERTILPLYHEDREGWIRMMKQAIARIGPVFNSQQMMRRYASEAYLR